MNENTLTPSEVMVLFADRFADTEPATDSSTEKPLAGERAVRSERLAVAVIRAVVLTNAQLGVSELTWRAPAELKRDLESLASGGGLLGALYRSPLVQSVLDQPVPHLEPGPRQHRWPEGTVEALLANPEQPGSLPKLLGARLGLRSGGGLTFRIKERMAERGLLQRFQRGFGLLVAGFRLPEATRQLAQAQLPALEGALRAAQRDDPSVWNGLGESVTHLLRQGD